MIPAPISYAAVEFSVGSGGPQLKTLRMAGHDEYSVFFPKPCKHGGLMAWWDWLFTAVIVIGIIEFGVLIWVIFFVDRKSSPK
jgi:hypothetical protein